VCMDPFSTFQVRAFACRCLQNLPDEELATYLPQLTQALKYELYHYSALAQLLLLRGAEMKRRRRQKRSKSLLVSDLLHRAAVSVNHRPSPFLGDEGGHSDREQRQTQVGPRRLLISWFVRPLGG